MSENNKVQQTEGQGLSIASLVLGILAIITCLVWYIGIVLGVLAVIFGVVSVKKRGRKKAIAGIVTGSIGIILSLLILLAIPALQTSQRDTARKNDVSVLASEVLSHQTNNRGQLPTVSDLSTSSLILVTSLAGEGEPTTEKAIYKTGTDCAGVSSERAYSVTVLLESGSIYCQGS